MQVVQLDAAPALDTQAQLGVGVRAKTTVQGDGRYKRASKELPASPALRAAL